MPPLKFRLPSVIAAAILWFAFIFLTGSQAAAQTLPSGGRLWTAIKEQSYCPGEPNRFSFVSVTDASTSTRIARWGFLDSQGNNVRVIGGLAFDNTRRVVWYTSLIRSCTGPTQGDGFIYRRPARGFTVTSIPDPGGPGGPGIGAMDYDAEEDVLWVAAFRPVNGQSVFYKINPANGNVLKTISIPATIDIANGPEVNDTLAIARPADLGGAKVLLTDAGAQETTTLYAVDVNTGAVLKTYPLQALGGIEVDDETGDLLVARNGTNQIFIQNRGPAPYDGSKGGFTVETDFAAPPFYTGDLAIEPLSCAVETIDRPGSQTVSGHNWSMNVTVSDNDGIVLRDVMLGSRYMAKEMSLPYYVLQTSALVSTRAELMPDSTATTARSRLVSFAVNTDNEKLVIEGTYAVDRIPASSQSCLFITQKYEFHTAATGCEPTETLLCATWKPIVQYRFVGKGGNTFREINVAQRLEFQPDGRPGNTITFAKDCESFLDGGAIDGTELEPCLYTCLDPTSGFICRNPPGIGLNIFLPGIQLKRNQNPLISEAMDRAIVNGGQGERDNLHITSKEQVELPLPVPPGCPECIHMHWRWAKYFRPSLIPPSFGEQFGGGNPLIPPGSNQDVNIFLVRAKPDEADPTNLTSVVNGEPLLPAVAVWYSAWGFQAKDAFFTHGGFFKPAARNTTAQTGLVAVTYFNLFEDGPLTVNPFDPTTAGALAVGYTVYNNLAYDIATAAVVSGPHTVSINVPSSTDPEVFASLRILHGEPSPSDPNSMILVDRTILTPDPQAPNVDTRTISARVDSFSPFVIARVSDVTRPSSTATIAPAPNADDWNNADATVTINATDNSAVRQITYTNALTGVSKTVSGATATVPVTIEGGNEIIYYAVDKFGNVEAPKSIFVNIDRSPPYFLFIGTPSPEPNAAGWNNSDVSISYAVDDNDGSGVFPSQRMLVLSNEGAAFTPTITITDRAGNNASQATVPVSIDKTSPVTTHAVSLTGTQATVTLSPNDNLSRVATTTYTINNGVAQSYSGPFSVNGVGSYTINYYSTDVADNTEATKTASFTIASAPTTVTLVAIKDSFLRDGADDTNEGANERLRIQSSGHNRVLVAFDLSNISTTNLVSATLVMNIGENSDNWGSSGQLVDVQRLLVDWTQSNGRNDVMVGGGPGFRGTGEGVTWNCAKDADISNQRADCGAQWNGGSFAAATAPGVLHTRGLLGEVRWDVTADVRAGASFGWVIKKRVEGQSGQVRYFSREGTQGNASLAPRLVLVYSH